MKRFIALVSIKIINPVHRWIIFFIMLAILVLLMGASYAWRRTNGNENVLTSDTRRASVDSVMVSLEAYNQFVQGRNSWSKRDERSIRRAINFFKRAIELKATMAQAYAGLADCYTALGYGSYETPSRSFLPADSAAHEALKIDSTLPDAHVSLGYIKLYYYRDWAGAEKEFIKAIQLDHIMNGLSILILIFLRQ